MVTVFYHKQCGGLVLWDPLAGGVCAKCFTLRLTSSDTDRKEREDDPV